MPEVDQSEVVEPTEDLNEEDVVSKITAAMDSRFSGFQGILDKNISTLRSEFGAQLEEVKRSRLSPEEREDLEETEREATLRRLERENALLKLRKDYPDEVDFLSDWLAKEDFNDQLAALREFRKRNQIPEPTPREDLDEDESTSPVDNNNPPRKGGDNLASLMRNGEAMTREQAQKLLNATNERGILARLRRGE